MMDRRRFVLPVHAVVCLALCGCASPGFPRAPSLHLPAPVKDLAATRIGDRVELHWTAPTSTTDGLDVTFATTVEVCRDMDGVRGTGEAAQQACTAVERRAGHAGPSFTVDQLPASLEDAQNARQLLAYRVRILNPAGRAAAPVAVALVPAGPSPVPVEAFHAVQEKDGVLLEWRKTAAASGVAAGSSGTSTLVEVLRTDLVPKPVSPSVRSSGQAEPEMPKPLTSKPVWPKRTEQAAASAELRLSPDAAGLPAEGASTDREGAEREGMIDRAATPDGTYSYRAQRVVTVALGGKSFEIFSESTASVTVAMRDVFPPAIPQGLASVPGTAVRPGSGVSVPTGDRTIDLTIDLSWQPNTEADLAGYLVYRTDLGSGVGSGGSGQVRLTASPVPGPAFRDAAVVAGHRYEYRVTAVDRSGNESGASAPTQDTPGGR